MTHRARYATSCRSVQPAREFHVHRNARDRYDLDTSLFALHGNAIIADFTTAQRVAHAINGRRDIHRFPHQAIRAGDLFAAGLIDEILHLVIQMYRETVNPNFVNEALAHLEERLGPERLERSLRLFGQEFPSSPVYRSETDLASYMNGSSDGTPHRYAMLEEMLLLDVACDNPALEPFAELLDDRRLAEEADYRATVRELETFVGDQPGFSAAGGATSLFDLLRAPARHAPTSLEGQLDFMRRAWSPFLGEKFGELVTKILRSLDVMKEERKWGFVGGEAPSVVLDAHALAGSDFSRGPVEYERFSPDSSWMPRVVMLAKSSFVWLDQLSKTHGREIRTLDQIPDGELDELARRGFNGLWLIGLWERSEASRRIKHLRGNPDAVASAYALYDYEIAAALGGEAAYENLRDRAHARGIRLASDMVPNHMGIDSRWVVQHPDWFLQIPETPYPGYTFEGPDLSHDPNVAIHLEDHYYDSSDAAVVFKRTDRNSGEARYIYHGNDGTSMPWNDTAQLDYSKAEVREAVIQTILHVARKFPIIRFDAAMTLAKQHVQRLWFPEPGHGGAIPSRTQYGSMTNEEFDRAVPEEFWREVVDRVATEVPDTLLLAEAFWMMEGYFVRTLGMHRVYNSAFMNMMKREENAEHRQLIKNVLEFDPQILKRFVNFMNNPDEETAVHQFGRDDKYFGVCLVMATLPGLPMFGHGQVEGFTEKYGMEYQRAKLDETPDAWLIERHRREIFPLLHRRAQFAEVENFHLYDLWTPDGHVDENVYAYSNRVGDEASLVLYNNRFGQARGWLKDSVAYAVKGSGDEKQLERRSLVDGLGLRAGDGDYLVFRDAAGGHEYLRRSVDLRNEGFYVELEAFKYHAFLDFREVVDSAEEPYARLHDELGGRGVASVRDALDDLRLRPLHDAVANVVKPRTVALLADRVRRQADDLMEDLEPAFRELLEAARPHGGASGSSGEDAAVARFRALVGALADPAATQLGPDDAGSAAAVEAVDHGLDATAGTGMGAAAAEAQPTGSTLDERQHALLLTWATLHSVGGLDVRHARLEGAAARLFASLGFEGDAEALARRVVALLEFRTFDDETLEPVALLAGLRSDERAQRLLGVNEHEGVRWFNREAYRAWVDALVYAALLDAHASDDEEARERAVEVRGALYDAEERSGYRLDDLALEGQATGSADAGAGESDEASAAAARDDVPPEEKARRRASGKKASGQEPSGKEASGKQAKDGAGKPKAGSGASKKDSRS